MYTLLASIQLAVGVQGRKRIHELNQWDWRQDGVSEDHREGGDSRFMMRRSQEGVMQSSKGQSVSELLHKSRAKLRKVQV